MLTSGEFQELQPLKAWARHLGIPDPLVFLDDDLAIADTEGMRDTVREVWGTANAPSRHAQEATAAMETLRIRSHNSGEGWAGRSQQEFTAALEVDQGRLRGALDRLTVLGDASTRVADGMETAYTNAMIACLRASTQVAEIAARDPERTPATCEAIANVIARALRTTVDECLRTRGEVDELTHHVQTADDDSTHGPRLRPSRDASPELVPVSGPGPDERFLTPADGARHDSDSGAAAVGSGASLRVHVVAEGDTMWDLAERYLGDPHRWPEIYHLNPQLADPDVIHPGQRLLIPDTAGPEHPGASPGDPSTPQPGAPSPEPPDSSRDPSQPTPDRPADPPQAPTEPPAVAQDPRDGPSGDERSLPDEPPDPEQPTDRDSGSQLPSGAWVALGVVVAVLAAWKLAAMRRRHAEPHAHRDGTVQQEEPSLVQALRNVTGEQQLSGLPEDPRYGAPIPSIHDRTGTEPDLIAWASGGIGLTGPGAEPVARAAIASVLCAGGPLTPEQRGTVVATQTAVSVLAGGAPLGTAGDLKRLVTLSQPDDVTQWLHVEIVRRRRLCEEHGVEDIAQLAKADPYAQPLAPILAALPVPGPGYTHSLRTLLAEGAPLGIAAVLFGDWPNATVFVDGDGRLSTTSRTPADLSNRGRLSTLTAADFHDALRVAAAAAEAVGVATDDDLLLTRLPELKAAPAPGATITPPTAVERTHPTGEEGPSEEHDEERGTAYDGTHSGADADADVDVPDIRAALQPRPDPDRPDTDASDAEPEADAESGTYTPTSVPPALRASSETLIKLNVLGHMTLSGPDGPIARGVRTDSKALLVLLAAYPEGRTLDQIITALEGPEADKGAPGRCRTAITSLRRTLRKAVDDKAAEHTYVQRVGRTYRLEPGVFDVDLWRMHAFIAAADAVGDDAERLAALADAARAYGGDFAADHDRQPWVAEHAARYRDQHLTVLDRITEITETDQPDMALAALRAATEHDPAGEARYQIMIRILGRLGRYDAVRHTLRLCHTRLAQIGKQPTEATMRVAARQFH